MNSKSMNIGWRDRVWSDLGTPWDVIIIGGGVTGSGVFLETVRAGLRALLVESNDFAYGTSSKSSKLVHGGFRYLKNRQFRVTYDSVRQRERLLKEARYLVSPLPFIFPHYRKKDIFAIAAGLTVYDLMGSKWKHHRLSAQQIIRKYPSINPKGLLSGHLYYDALMDDARFVYRLIREAVIQGGTALNYARAVELLKNKDNRVCGIRLDDMSSGISSRTTEVHAPVIINATGPWTDELRLQAGGTKRVRKLRGSHLLYARERFPIEAAVTIVHPRDKRVMFAIPWENCTILGTTDLDHTPELETQRPEPFVTTPEFEYMIEAVTHSFPSAELLPEDVISCFSGLRPIVTGGAVSPSKESRGHVVLEDNGLFTITGGKFTTYRLMTGDILRAISPHLIQETHFIESNPVFSPSIDFPGDLELPEEQVFRIAGRYGLDTLRFFGGSTPEELEPIKNSTTTLADIRWAAREEGVVHLDDLLLRRTRIGLTNPLECSLIIPKIKDIIIQELGWDEQRWIEEYTVYAKLWKDCYFPSL